MERRTMKVTRKNLILHILFNLKQADTQTIYRLLGLKHRSQWNNTLTDLKELMIDGYITRTQRGIYSLTTKGIKEAVKNELVRRIDLNV
jgi:predicted transcriptional regulator